MLPGSLWGKAVRKQQTTHLSKDGITDPRRVLSRCKITSSSLTSTSDTAVQSSGVLVLVLVSVCVQAVAAFLWHWSSRHHFLLAHPSQLMPSSVRGYKWLWARAKVWAQHWSLQTHWIGGPGKRGVEFQSWDLHLKKKKKFIKGTDVINWTYYGFYPSSCLSWGETLNNPLS